MTKAQHDDMTGELDLCTTPAYLAERATTAFAESEAAKVIAKRTFNRCKMALDVQDAGNLRGIARSFVEVCDDASNELKATTLVWKDPAVVLFAAKIAELCGIGLADLDVYGKALNACRKNSQEKGSV